MLKFIEAVRRIFGFQTTSSTSSANSIELTLPQPVQDTYEGCFFEEAQTPRPLSARLAIKYVNANGEASRRIVQLREFDSGSGNHGLILGFCELRKAARTFRYDRIQECIDVESGEVVEGCVKRYLDQRYDASPERSLERFGTEYSDALECLIYVIKADGRLTAAERSEMAAFARRHVLNDRVTDEQLQNFIKGIRVVSLTTFRRAVGRVAKLDEELRRDIVETAERIVGSQKTVHPAERDAITYLAKRLLTTQPAG